MATVKIIEQPAKTLRFRYEREGRAGGLIVGASTTPHNKVYPKIKVEGYQGRALVIVSCVTNDEPYRPHPHKLVGKDSRKGVCSAEVSLETMSVEFSHLGIHCMRRKDIEQSLNLRKEIRVDPFRTGFARYKHSISYDLTAVRLCFQVFLQDERGDFTVALTPVVSEPVYDKRVVGDLTIVKISKCVAPVNGGQEDIILVCDKVTKTDIKIRFYEEHEGQVIWEAYGIFQPSDVYKQVVIWFRPPCYKSLDITKPVNAFIQLERPSDAETSEPLPFEFLPIESDETRLNRIRQKSKHLLRNFSLPPITTQDQNIIASYPQRTRAYSNINPIDLPNPIISSQQQYNFPLTSMSTTPLMTNLQSNPFQFSNIQLDQPTASGTTRTLNASICELNPAHSSTFSLRLHQKHSEPEKLNSLSPQIHLHNEFSPSPMDNGVLIPNLELLHISPDIDEDKRKMENALTSSDSTKMDIQNLNDLSSLLNIENIQQLELQQIDIDSGELELMNISS